MLDNSGDSEQLPWNNVFDDANSESASQENSKASDDQNWESVKEETGGTGTSAEARKRVGKRKLAQTDSQQKELPPTKRMRMDSKQLAGTKNEAISSGSTLLFPPAGTEPAKEEPYKNEIGQTKTTELFPPKVIIGSGFHVGGNWVFPPKNPARRFPSPTTKVLTTLFPPGSALFPPTTKKKKRKKLYDDLIKFDTNKAVFLVQGCPGIGKSTIAPLIIQALAKNNIKAICMEHDNNIYRKNKLWTQFKKKFSETLESGEYQVVILNRNNSHYRQYKAYLNICRKNEYNILALYPSSYDTSFCLPVVLQTVLVRENHPSFDEMEDEERIHATAKNVTHFRVAQNTAGLSELHWIEKFDLPKEVEEFTTNYLETIKKTRWKERPFTEEEIKENLKLGEEDYQVHRRKVEDIVDDVMKIGLEFLKNVRVEAREEEKKRKVEEETKQKTVDAETPQTIEIRKSPLSEATTEATITGTVV